jgi:hypothetical protein
MEHPPGKVDSDMTVQSGDTGTLLADRAEVLGSLQADARVEFWIP